jgi:hypothetical protein
VNCWVFPAFTVGFAGVMTILSSVADDTVTVVDPVLPLATCVALIVAVPTMIGVTSPFAILEFPTVATNLFDDFQVTCEVRSWVVESEKVPVAVYCDDAPMKIVALAGVTVMEDRVAEVTVSVAVFVTTPNAAVISWVDPSLKFPVAVYCNEVPREIWVVVGETTMDDSVAAVTVSVEVPEMPSNQAVMVDEPAATGVASPMDPAALLIVATPTFDEVQVTSSVRSWTEPSE